MTGTASKETLLSVSDLKTYFPTDEGVVKAVDGISFEIKPGQTLGVVGESGCGKSTVGRSILQILDKPGVVEDGEMLWRTESLNGSGTMVDLAKEKPNGRTMRAIRGQDIALVFQEPMTSFSPVHSIGNQMTEVIRLLYVVKTSGTKGEPLKRATWTLTGSGSSQICQPPFG